MGIQKCGSVRTEQRSRRSGFTRCILQKQLATSNQQLATGTRSAQTSRTGGSGEIQPREQQVLRLGRAPFGASSLRMTASHTFVSHEIARVNERRDHPLDYDAF